MIIKKKLGQHFIINNNLIKYFIDLIDIKNNNIILEIGAGFGYITSFLVKKTNNLILLEIDKNLYNFLLKKFKKYKKIFILNRDARYVNIEKIKLMFINKNYKLKIIGSLPYCSSIPILLNLNKYYKIIDSAYFIIQKEVAEKLKCSNGFNSKLSVIINIFFNIEIINYKIYPNSFFPIPKVNSSIIKLTPKFNINISKINFLKFKFLLNLIFNKKRKMIKNSLKSFINFDKIKNICDPNFRHNKLSLNDFYNLHKYI
ncbi:ribosomal RNA small subunit methyltransferase A [endosymbiont of Euscepes postfasciatus]|uniref:16S rRNA (adenine(1518)-N(6)/adenine(1519)-N(6))- dimethyltransferase RsmA n=1 Tax=endosymbiont of Euscepes postfasciatus TaxID=650377 RepID=UPI000DC6E3C8|nr:16S rRNA (adenine(1518)-N(6)/adenine(1519)-N(6))-dimethyltransferase RsmA [endosymbiont of Euscepes postfasciatus]BBA84620.1 ribosomal RNA small subunit methyltransferase A [endosymbiont of Euscepes postfasciatus]